MKQNSSFRNKLVSQNYYGFNFLIVADANNTTAPCVSLVKAYRKFFAGGSEPFAQEFSQVAQVFMKHCRKEARVI